uniref:Epithelial membrane protein 3a (MAM blood group) n=1 Tax=Gadus morhua TaxID=8049 RepID=A0A8C5BN76_GADMO
MVLLLLCVTVMHLVTLALLLIATLEKVSTTAAGFTFAQPSKHTQVNIRCFPALPDWLHSIQALMVLSVVLSSISFLVFVGQLFTLSTGGLFYLTGLCQTFSGFAAFAACLIFTFRRKEILDDVRDLSTGHFGYCFIMAWVCVPLLLLSGVLYVHLRKKQ